MGTGGPWWSSGSTGVFPIKIENCPFRRNTLAAMWYDVFWFTYIGPISCCGEAFIGWSFMITLIRGIRDDAPLKRSFENDFWHRVYLGWSKIPNGLGPGSLVCHPVWAWNLNQDPGSRQVHRTSPVEFPMPPVVLDVSQGFPSSQQQKTSFLKRKHDNLPGSCFQFILFDTVQRHHDFPNFHPDFPSLHEEWKGRALRPQNPT